MKLFYILILGILWNAHCSVGDSDVDAVLRKLDNHSKKIAALTTEINTFAKTNLVKFYKLTQSNSKLCAETINSSKSYIQQIQGATKDEAMKLHRIIVGVLDTALKALISAEENRLAARQRFLDTVRENEGKISRLSGEFNDKIVPEVLELVKRLELEADKSRQCSRGSCADTEKTRQIKSLIQNIRQKQYKVRGELNRAFENSDLKMQTTRRKFDDEFYPISDLKVTVKADLSLITEIVEEGKHDSDTIKLIKGDIEKLIAECQKYIDEHKF